MSRLVGSFVAALVVVGISGCGRSAPSPTLIQTDSGLVAGRGLDSGVKAWLGIPFAPPPVRELRWKEAQPITWQGVYNADRKMSACIQILRPHNINHYFGEEPTSEDCLYMNIWAPADATPASRLPVIVFIYGGGEGSEVAIPAIADILRAYFRLPADSPLASPPQQPIAPPVIVRPPSTGPAAPPAHKYTGRLLGVDNWRDEQPGIFGTVVDANGRGVNGVRVVADKCDNNAIFTSTTDGNGAFSFNGVYWHDTLRWCVRTLVPADSDAFVVEVAPYKRYTVQFVPTQ